MNKRSTRRPAIKKPPILFSKTQKTIAQLEKELGARFLSYWTSPNGSVCDYDVMALYEVLSHLGPSEEIVLCIKSSGGSGEASLRLIHLLRQYAKHLVAVIPLECASAATMMALGADEIRMGPLAYLTAIDTSLRHELSPVDIDNELVSVSQDELLRVIRLWKETSTQNDGNPYQTLFQHVNPLVIGAVDRISSLSLRLSQEILSFHIKDEKKAEKIGRQLSEGYPSHDYPIILSEAQRIGLDATPLDSNINVLLLELNELYAEMGQRAVTDYDEFNYHSHEIVNIVEGKGIQVLFQNDKDWHYRKEERRWVSLNDESSWYRFEKSGTKVAKSILHIR
jgi:hypothetical protein